MVMRTAISDTRKVARMVSDKIGCQIVSHYFAQLWFGRLRFHFFYRPDPATALHDHPWSFITFPLRSYVEEVLYHDTGKIERKVVRAFRPHRRPMLHTHRYLGRWSGRGVEAIPNGYVPTIVWLGRRERTGFSFWEVRKMRVMRYDWVRYMRRGLRG